MQSWECQAALCRSYVNLMSICRCDRLKLGWASHYTSLWPAEIPHNPRIDPDIGRPRWQHARCTSTMAPSEVLLWEYCISDGFQCPSVSLRKSWRWRHRQDKWYGRISSHPSRVENHTRLACNRVPYIDSMRTINKIGGCMSSHSDVV